MKRVICAKFVLSDEEDDEEAVRVSDFEDLRSNIKNLLGHAPLSIAFFLEGDPGYGERPIDVEYIECSVWKAHVWEKGSDYLYHCIKCCFVKTWDELAMAERIGLGPIRLKTDVPA